ncbi:hypothetical protein BGZ94_004428 [Podila epigama]|nr:hypothetical protein BGZ94_004428 [Podila epigama]
MTKKKSNKNNNSTHSKATTTPTPTTSNANQSHPPTSQATPIAPVPLSTSSQKNDLQLGQSPNSSNQDISSTHPHTTPNDNNINTISNTSNINDRREFDAFRPKDTPGTPESRTPLEQQSNNQDDSFQRRARANKLPSLDDDEPNNNRSDDRQHSYLAPRLPSRQYEDDDDDHPHLDGSVGERSPLIRSSSHNSNYSDSSSGRHPPTYPAPGTEPYEPTTWLEWSLKNGLHPRTWDKKTYIKAALLSTLITLVVLSFTVFRVQDHIKDILRYIDSHKRVGAILFVVSYTIACTLFLPGSLFTIGAGFLFKPFPLALLIVLLGDVFAAIGSFLFGRYVFYDWVKNMMSKHPKFNALDQVIKDDGWKIVVMLRLTPIPFNLITYFFSITSIRLWTVVWATCVGVFPGSCLGIWIGSLLKGLSGIDNPELETHNVVILVMNGVFIACSILILSLFGKRSLRKAMKRLEQHQALTRMHEVEIVVEGVATVIRELEDNASIPPSLRSTMIEQLAAEDDQDRDAYYHNDLESAHERLLPNHSASSSSSSSGPGTAAREEETATAVSSGSHTHATSKARRLLGLGQDQSTRPVPPTLPSSGFTRGEKITFVVIGVVAIVNICVGVPLYYHFKNQGKGDDGGPGMY